MTPQQWTLEQSLTDAMSVGDSQVGNAAEVYADTVRAEPQHSFHFGIRYHERGTFEEQYVCVTSRGHKQKNMAMYCLWRYSRPLYTCSRQRIGTDAADS